MFIVRKSLKHGGKAIVVAALQLFVLLSMMFGQQAFGASFQEQLRQADRYMEDDKPQSAAQILESVIASKKAKPIELLEAATKLSSVYKEYMEDSGDAVLGLFHDLEHRLSGQYLAVDYALIADFYIDFLNNGKFPRFANNAATLEEPGTDYTKWSRQTLQDTIWYYQLKSVETAPGLCQKTPVGDFEKILYNASIFIGNSWTDVDRKSEKINLVTNLHQLLICNAIEHQVNPNWADRMFGTGAKMLADKRVCSNATDFIELCAEYNSRSSSCGPLYMLGLLSNQSAGMPTGIRAAIDLYRIRKLSSAQKPAYYADGLRNIVEYYNGLKEPLSAVFYYLLAEHYSENDPDCADSICNAAIDMFPNSPGASMCSALKQSLRKPDIQAYFSKVLYPESENVGYVTVTNVERVFFTLVPIQNQTFDSYIQNHGADLKSLKNDKNTGIDWNNAVDWEQKVADNPSFERKKLFFTIPKPKFYEYILIITDKPGLDSESTAVICSLSCRKYAGMLAQTTGKDNFSVGAIADLNSGKPAAGKKYSFYSAEYSSLLKKDVAKDLYAQGYVGNNGFVQIGHDAKKMKSGRYIFSFDDGSYSLNHYVSVGNVQNLERDNCYLYTDRRTYKPGDTVQVYAVFEDTDRNGKSKLAVGRTLSLELRGTADRIIQQFEQKTDGYGACVFSCILPLDLQTGPVQIYAKYLNYVIGNSSVNVIEYVQPKMNVSLTVNQPYCAFGKPVMVIGRAESFSGVPIQGSVVKYYIECSEPRYFLFKEKPHMVKSGKTAVGSDGTFCIEFTPMLPDNPQNVNNLNFDVHATVVASDGNSMEQNLSVPVSREPFSISMHGMGDETVSNGSVELNCGVVNSMGKTMDVSYSYKLYKLKDQTPKYAVPSSIDYRTGREPIVCQENIEELERKFPNYAFNNGDDYNSWSEESLICSGLAVSDIPMTIAGNLENGVYRLTVNYTDDGRTVSETRHIVSVAPGSKKAVGNKLFAATLDKSEYRPGETALLTVLSPYKDVTVYCIYMNADGICKKDTIGLSESVRTFPIAVTQQDADGICIDLMAVKDRHMENTSLRVNVCKGQMDLVIDKFDAKMESGSSERLALHVTDATGKPARARILLSVNDASLYHFGQNDWQLPFGRTINRVRSLYSAFNAEQYLPMWYYERSGKPAGYVVLKIATLQNGLYRNSYMDLMEGLTISSAIGSNRLQGSVNGLDVVKSVKLSDEAAVVVGEEMNAEDSGLESLLQNSSVERSDFGNTALFKVLDTDKYGTLNIPFKAPDLLTEWNMQALAYNTSLERDYESRRSKTYRTVMIEALPLQFVTQGDTVQFTARVSNTSDHDADAQVLLKLKDGKGNVLTSALPDGSVKEVTVPATGTASVAFKVAVPIDIQNLDYTFVVNSAWGADGEHNVLPVRSNAITLTESAAFYNNGNEKRMFPITFTASAREKANSLKLEVTPDAVWCALRSLPGLADKDAVSNYGHFLNLYADMLYYSIFKDYPDIQKETDADSVQMLAAKTGIRRNFDKLDNAVEDDGGWSWIGGYSSDFYITLQILKGFAELQHLGALENSLDILDKAELYTLIGNAVEYIDAAMLDQYTKEVRNRSKRSSIDYYVMLYLYTRTLWQLAFDIDRQYSKMFDYYMNVVLKQKRNSLNLRERALLSLTLSWQGNNKAARKYAEGLVERALTEDEFGMFWRDNTGCSAIELQSLIIQALSGSGYAAESELATRWLVKQKQATAWKNAHETAYAIASLLGNGALCVPAEDSQVTISFGGADIEPVKVSGRYDYTEELNTEYAASIENIGVETQTKTMCWGSLYCEYTDNIDNIQPFGQGVSITRSYYIVNGNENGTSLTKVSDLNRIKVGDKILVRLTVTSDRAADYVEIKDMRAAGFIVSDQRARYETTGNNRYYVAPGKDNCRIYISRVKRGEQVVEYCQTKVADGQFTIGPATMECTIAPEFRANTTGSIGND